jgi:hypothetical protein
MYKKWQSSLRRFSQIGLQTTNKAQSFNDPSFMFGYTMKTTCMNLAIFYFFSLSLLGTAKTLFFFLLFFCFFISFSGYICPVREGW